MGFVPKCLGYDPANCQEAYLKGCYDNTFKEPKKKNPDLLQINTLTWIIQSSTYEEQGSDLNITSAG